MPTIETARLRLRPLADDDAPRLVELVGDRAIAATTLRIPHPYTSEDATRYLGHVRTSWSDGNGLALGIALRETDALIGSAGLEISRAHQAAELGYWIGVPYWGNGFATEAVTALIDYGFKALDLNRIEAHCFSGNAASETVLQRVGMTHEGVMRERVRKGDAFLDTHHYAVLRREWTR